MTGEADLGWPRVALFSLSDKSGVTAFAQALAQHGTRLIASGGTADHLRSAGLEVTSVESLTGLAELLGGRVKTLHPILHAGILAKRDDPAHAAQLEQEGIEPIDLVCVSLYPFEERAAKLDETGAVEEIDIGGVALLRGAAKNFAHVVVLHDPTQYGEALAAFGGGGPSLEQRRGWAQSVFARTARYDGAIANELARRSDATGTGGETPRVLVLPLERVRPLRYGENPHQPGALYARLGDAARLDAWKEGKELSYNNLLDLEAAVTLVARFERPSCVIVKHNQPCGAASADTVLAAWQAARRTDELSAFGGVVAFNRPLDQETALAMSTMFLECVAAPEFEPAVEQAFKSKKNLRLVRLTSSDVTSREPWEVRLAGPWALLQIGGAPEPAWRVVSKRPPTDAETRGLRFAWEICAAARSNAIAIARGEALIGLGSGQTSRVDAVDVALMKARRSGHEIKGASLASDGFFPFPDGVAHAAQAGVTAMVQPGGSTKDAEVIAEADTRGVAMVFTDRRTFRH
jgi:phosphoribosylaminoimidazolecarboxamide formyltransferase/IMP cyclohydrolase